MKTELIEKAYAIARERYAEIGVDTEKALAALQNISLSLHCWQADDVTGFETRAATSRAASRLRATTRAKPATSKSCVPTSSRPSRSFPVRTA